MSSEITKWSILETRKQLIKKAVSPVEVVKAYIDNIESLDGEINAFITVLGDKVLEEAVNLEKNLDQILEKPLGGIPVAVKDCICTEGVRTTCGSKMLESFVPFYNATVVDRLKKAGAIILGKTNMDEFAMGSSTEHSYFGPTKNPWDKRRVAGGSSGGSAAAVAARFCAASVGTDTGGSIRQPAAFCGVVGLKPTYGRVSRYGLIAFASSLDQIGPLGQNVYDTAIMMQVLAGYDPLDTTSILKEVPNYLEEVKKPVKSIRLGVPREYFRLEGMDPDIKEAIKDSLKTFENMGFTIVDISLPHTEYGVAAYYIIAPAEASSNLARYDGVKYGYRASGNTPDLTSMYHNTRSEGFGPEVKRRIMLGTYVLSSGYYEAYYKKASQVRSLIKKDFDEAFLICDAIITPVTPVVPFFIGEKLRDPLSMYLSDIFTLPASLAGIPGLSIPCGVTPSGLPVGMQILGNYFREDVILRIAAAFEQERNARK